MKTYTFTEATPLLNFIAENKQHIVGGTLKRFDAEYWLHHNSKIISDLPIVLLINDYCVAVNYLVPSDMELIIGTKEELTKTQEIHLVVTARDEIIDYFGQQFETGIKQECIEGCTIKDIHIERFSDEFECNGATSEMRPAGGDYFSTIKLHLDSGVVLCLRGAEAILDGYIEYWCEEK